MKSIESLIAASHENFDLTSRSDQARLNGEDSLRTKLSQLDWITPGTEVAGSYGCRAGRSCHYAPRSGPNMDPTA